ncbi:MAG: hypothetical protein AAGE43_09810 [Pseudomonadota bacterium]
MSPQIRTGTQSFSLPLLAEAIEAKKNQEALSWQGVARAVGRFVPVSAGTISKLGSRPTAEGDGVLQILLWLERSPECFVAGFSPQNAERYLLTPPPLGKILRWDTTAIHRALNAARSGKNLSWVALADRIGGVSAATLTALAKGGRTHFPMVMRITTWLDTPAATFTRLSDR